MMNDRLGIAARGEAMAGALQRRPQQLKVIDLPVERDLNLAVLVPQRLRAACEIDYRQPTMSQRDFPPPTAAAPDAAPVRTAVAQAVGHSLDDCRLIGRRRALNISGDSAHAFRAARARARRDRS